MIRPEREQREGNRRPEAPAGAATPPAPGVTLILGEGTSAEGMLAMRRVLDAAGARLEWEMAEAGERVRAKGIASGLPWETIDSIGRTGLVVRGSLSAPGPCSTDRLLHEGLGIVAQALRIRSLRGVWTGLAERDLDFWLVRSALGAPGPTSVSAGPLDREMFRQALELARQEGATRVRCAIQPGRHGLLRVQRTFLSAGGEYPEIGSECVNQYLLAQELIAAPEQFEVIVTSDAVGDVITELAGRVVGGLSFVGSVEIGAGVAMFAPARVAEVPLAGRGRANPVGAIRSGVLLLERVRQETVARRIEQALTATLEQGLGTDDMPRARRAASTAEFADAVVSNLDSGAGRATPTFRAELTSHSRRGSEPHTVVRLPR